MKNLLGLFLCGVVFQVSAVSYGQSAFEINLEPSFGAMATHPLPGSPGFPERTDAFGGLSGGLSAYVLWPKSEKLDLGIRLGWYLASLPKSSTESSSSLRACDEQPSDAVCGDAIIHTIISSFSLKYNPTDHLALDFSIGMGFQAPFKYVLQSLIPEPLLGLGIEWVAHRGQAFSYGLQAKLDVLLCHVACDSVRVLFLPQAGLVFHF